MTKYYKRTPSGLVEVSIIDAQALRDSEKVIIPDTKDGTGTPKAKWGTKQGNFMKVHPLDRN